MPLPEMVTSKIGQQDPTGSAGERQNGPVEAFQDQSVSSRSYPLEPPHKSGAQEFERVSRYFVRKNTIYKKLLGAPGLTTRSKDATRGSWHRY